MKAAQRTHTGIYIDPDLPNRKIEFNKEATMKNAFIVAIFALLLSPQIIAKDRFIKIKSKEHSCEALRGIVNEEKLARIKGFGSLDVYSTRFQACNVIKRCARGLAICEPFRTTWRTTDKRFCTVGFTCKVTPDNSR